MTGWIANPLDVPYDTTGGARSPLRTAKNGELPRKFSVFCAFQIVLANCLCGRYNKKHLFFQVFL